MSVGVGCISRRDQAVVGNSFNIGRCRAIRNANTGLDDKSVFIAVVMCIVPEVFAEEIPRSQVKQIGVETGGKECQSRLKLRRSAQVIVVTLD